MSKKNRKKYLLPGDIIIIAAVALIALALVLFFALLPSESGLYVRLEYGDENQLISLSKDGTYDLNSNGYRLTLAVVQGEAFVEYSDCPDRLCVKMGSISRAGESIVCVPAKLKLTVVGRDGGGFDAVAG